MTLQADIAARIRATWPLHRQFICVMKTCVPAACTLRRFAFDVAQRHWGELTSHDPKQTKIELRGNLIPFRPIRLPDGTFGCVSSFEDLWECTLKWAMAICV